MLQTPIIFVASAGLSPVREHWLQMYTAVPRQPPAHTTSCSFPAPVSIPACQHPPPRVAHQVRGAHTTLLPSPTAASERWFRFPCRSGLPSPPSGPSQPHGRARQAPPGQSRLVIPAGATGQARPGETREPTPSPPSPPPPGLPRPGTRLAPPRPRLAPGPGRALAAAAPRRHSPPALRPRSAAAAPGAGGGRAGKRGLAAAGGARCRQHGSVQPCPGAAAVPRPAAGEPVFQQLQLQRRILNSNNLEGEFGAHTDHTEFWKN
ncbi:LYR motif-containing protein 4 isoform 2-T11 [Cyanocitta cristata]